MEPVYFIPSVPTFIPAAWREDGTYNEDTFPVDAVLIDDSMATQYWKVTAPSGKVLGVADGLPCWVDIPVYVPTPEEVLAAVLTKRDNLLSLAAIRIAPLQDAVDLEEATSAEVALMKKWKQYRIAVNRIQDQSGYPSSIEWPVEPI